PNLIVRLAGADGSILLSGNPSRDAGRGMLTTATPVESSVLALARASAFESGSLVTRIAPKVILDQGGQRGSEFCGEFAREGDQCYETVRDGAVSVTMRKQKITVERYLAQ
ncbi:MAG: hypothetical protein ACRD1N_11040, partial [Terriglobia bacterium]